MTEDKERPVNIELEIGDDIPFDKLLLFLATFKAAVEKEGGSIQLPPEVAGLVKNCKPLELESEATNGRN